jgi:hypothetical protein
VVDRFKGFCAVSRRMGLVGAAELTAVARADIAGACGSTRSRVCLHAATRLQCAVRLAPLGLLLGRAERHPVQAGAEAVPHALEVSLTVREAAKGGCGQRRAVEVWRAPISLRAAESVVHRKLGEVSGARRPRGRPGSSALLEARRSDVALRVNGTMLQRATTQSGAVLQA